VSVTFIEEKWQKSNGYVSMVFNKPNTSKELNKLGVIKVSTKLCQQGVDCVLARCQTVC